MDGIEGRKEAPVSRAGGEAAVDKLAAEIGAAAEVDAGVLEAQREAVIAYLRARFRDKLGEADAELYDRLIEVRNPLYH